MDLAQSSGSMRDRIASMMFWVGALSRAGWRIFVLWPAIVMIAFFCIASGFSTEKFVTVTLMNPILFAQQHQATTTGNIVVRKCLPGPLNKADGKWNPPSCASVGPVEMTQEDFIRDIAGTYRSFYWFSVMASFISWLVVGFLRSDR